RQGRDLADPEQHPGHERRTVHRVVAELERLTVGAEDHFLMGDEPLDAQGVHTYAVHIGAACTGDLGGGGVGHRFDPGLTAGPGDQFCGVVGGTAGCVGLVGVVQLDDLGGIEVGRGLLGEVHHQYCGDAEVRCHEHLGPGRGGLHLAYTCQLGLVETAGTDDGVDTVADEPLQVVHDRVGVCEVHDTVGAAHRVPVVPLVHTRDQFHVVGALNGFDDL